MGEKTVDVERFAAAQNAGQIGIIICGALKNGSGRYGRDHNRRLAGGDLPQSSRALFLKFGMGRKILEGEHVTRRKSDDRIGIAGTGEFTKSAEDWNKILDGTVVIDYDEERPVGMSPQKHEQQGFCSGRKSGDTDTPRGLPEVGGYTRDGGKHFYVREEFANEGKQHAA